MDHCKKHSLAVWYSQCYAVISWFPNTSIAPQRNSALMKHFLHPLPPPPGTAILLTTSEEVPTLDISHESSYWIYNGSDSIHPGCVFRGSRMLLHL